MRWARSRHDDLHDELELLRRQAEPAPEDGEETRQRVLHSLAAPRTRVARAVRHVAGRLLGHLEPWPTTWARRARCASRPRGGLYRQPRRALPLGARHAPTDYRRPRRGEPAYCPTRKRGRVAPAVSAKHDAVVTAPAPAKPNPQQLASLYATAQRLHFRGAPHAALEAWNAFLATAPLGPLASEARYNRAVTLLRLGRVREAREALTPFARGDVAGFRKADAALLLRQLEVGAPTTESAGETGN